ncbi:MAG: hypothetical protein ACJZ8O_05500 [Pirellulaceae bacterium]
MTSETLTDSIGNRFLLWIDDIGGFLITRSNSFTIGRSGTHATSDVPINGDLATEHITIQSGSDYCVLIPHSKVLVNSLEVMGPLAIVTGDEITMGSVQLEVRARHPLSQTIGLKIISHHNTHGAKNILLMTRSIILGSKQRNHIVLGNGHEDTVIYESLQNKRLFFKPTAPIRVGERSTTNDSELVNGSCLESGDLTITVESLD